MNYPDNANMDLVLNQVELVFSHYEVSYDGDKVEDKEFDSLTEAFEFAKVYTKQMALDTELNFEKAALEIAYEGEMENDVFKTVEYDAKHGDWDVS